MKILMLTPYVPYPPSSGGQIRTYNLLRHLSKKNQITLVALYKNDEEKKHFSHLKKYCKKIYLCRRAKKPWQIKNIVKTVFSSLPFLIIRNYSREANDLIKEVIKKESFDVIHAETFYIMPHIPDTNIPILLAEQTIEYEVYNHFTNSLPFLLKKLFKLDIVKLKTWEKFYWRKADIVAPVSISDESLIKRLEPNIKTAIIPNGAGDEMFVNTLSEKNLDNPILLFQGNFFWLQNIEAANYLIDKVLPFISKIPKLKVVISGQNVNKIKRKGLKNLRFVNIDPDDFEIVKKQYKEATIFIAPIFGPGGTRLKILASMAMGVPVISTKTGLEGLEVSDNKEAVIANNPQEFAEKIRNMLHDKKLYEDVRKSAYNFVKKNYSWYNISQNLEKVYQGLIEKK